MKDKVQSRAVVLVSGYNDLGMARVMGCTGKETESYRSWGRLVAASGMACVAFECREPAADAAALLRHLRGSADVLDLDPVRIGLWSCSGNVPTALGVLMDDPHLACAALLYGYMLDLDGHTHVADAAAMFRFATPAAGRSVRDLPADLPLFIARAGRDETAGLNASLDAFVSRALAAGLFPEEREGIARLFEDMRGLVDEIGRLSSAGGQVDMSRFPTDFPHLFKLNGRTWGEMVDARIRNPKLKAIVSGQWGYYGLPPSRLSCFYYALPFLGYLSAGGCYPKGRSQDISNALARYITAHGGKVLLNARVDRILLSDQAATGVATANGAEFTSRAVVSNANPFDTFRRMIADQSALAAYEAMWERYSVSLSSFQVFLGLKDDLVAQVGLTTRKTMRIGKSWNSPVRLMEARIAPKVTITED